MKSLVSVVLLLALVCSSSARRPKVSKGCPKPRIGDCTADNCPLGECALLTSCIPPLADVAAFMYCSCTGNSSCPAEDRFYCKTITLGFVSEGSNSISFCTDKTQNRDCSDVYNTATEFCKSKGPRPDGGVAGAFADGTVDPEGDLNRAPPASGQGGRGRGARGGRGGGGGRRGGREGGK